MRLASSADNEPTTIALDVLASAEHNKSKVKELRNHSRVCRHSGNFKTRGGNSGDGEMAA
jgi:hypothetical protein